MIQFFVNNHELLLPEDFEVTIIEENPEITNNGEFTLDITLSLLEAKNAIAFGFLNRLNLTTIVKKAEARLIIDGRVSMGSIVIISNTDVEVTFQFVAGNSELNYNIYDDKRFIWELDWGQEENEITYEKALFSINNIFYGQHTGGFCNFVVTPFLVGETTYNKYTINEMTTSHPNAINGIGSPIVMQPYLLYYINKLPSLLGFSLNGNILNDDLRAKMMYLVNPIDSLKYSDALPNMSISEFVKAIEDFFSVRFYVNKENKAITIENLNTRNARKKTVVLNNYLDNYTRNHESETSESNVGFTKIEYDLPETNYFKLHKLSDDILEKVQFVDYPNMATLLPTLNNSDLMDKQIVYKTNDTLDEWALVGPTTGGKSYYHKDAVNGGGLHLINKFRSFSESDETVLTLKIQPAEMAIRVFTYSWYFNNSGSLATIQLATQMPRSSNSFGAPKPEIGFMQLIETSEQKINRLSYLEVALFSGKKQMYVSKQDQLNMEPWKDYPIVVLWPTPQTDNYPDMGKVGVEGDDYARFEAWRATNFFIELPTMRILGTHGVLNSYKQTRTLDVSKEYVFDLIDNVDIKPDNQFIINNSKYIPIKFERVKSNKSSTVKGYFYKML